MVRYLLPLRYLMLFASFGALLGATIMFWLAGGKLLHGAEVLWTTGPGAAGAVTAAVMGATDAFLFGIVLVIFAYAITYGLVLQTQEQVRERLPDWLRVQGVHELKHTLIEVVIVYLVVDFATDLAAGEHDSAWQTLVKPIAIVLIAATRWLMERHGPEAPARPSDTHRI